MVPYVWKWKGRRNKTDAKRVWKYGAEWKGTPLQIELEILKRGGKFRNKQGKEVGNGALFHFIEAVKLAFPSITIHDWNKKFFEAYLTHRTIGVIGAASTGKTNSAAICALVDYFTFPRGTTILCCSTTKERLEDRLWGEIKKLFRDAKDLHPWLDGNLIEGRQRIVTDKRNESAEGRDFRNGLIGVPCKKGGDYVGMSDFVGIKNTRVRLFGDELSMLPAAFVDAVSNLDKNPDFKLVGLGNPKDTTDALGRLCEPHPNLGGWEGGIDQKPGTKTWATKRELGICLQLPGSDSPNLDGKLGIPLITQAQIDRDVSFYGRDSLYFTMMNEGRMPRGQGTRRVITRQMCERFKAMEEPVWRDTNHTWIGFLDAAYGGVGGDRCIFGMLRFGYESVASNQVLNISTIINQNAQNDTGRKILALDLMTVVPIKNDAFGEFGEPLSPEDQITLFCMKSCLNRGIPPQNFYFDSGMRTSLVSSMARLWSPYVQSIDCGGTPSNRPVSGNIDRLCKDYYSKFVTELWFSVRLVIESGQFRGMKEDVMMEGCSREWTVVGANKIEVEPKSIMKEKTGRSPDLFDALAIGVEGARQRGFIIQRLGSETHKRQDTAWKSELNRRAARLWESGQLSHAD